MRVESGLNLLHYRVAEKIGEGGMGVVWRALDTTLDRDVALKVLPDDLVAAHGPERLARFEREARLLASLDHPNIATVYGLFEAEGVRFLAMEYIPGEDLAERLARGPLAIEDALAVGRSIAEALEAAHESGVVHRDLKPANVRMTPEGKIKVLDFGLAKAFAPDAVSGGETSASLSPTVTSAGTIAGVILGTAGYMSPEQAKGRPVDRRADIWAFGVLLGEMLSGTRRFHAETVSETIAQVLMKEISFEDLPDTTPSSVRVLLARCLERDPTRRLRDIGEARIALENVLGGDVEPEAPRSPTDRPAPGPRGAWVLTALFAVVAAFASFFALREDASPAGSTVGEVVFEIAPPEGTLLRTMYETAAPPVVSPDGRSIVFGLTDRDRVNRLWVRSLDGEARPIPGTEGGMRPFWSPDSRQLGFFTSTELLRIDLAGGPALTVCECIRYGRGGTWGADGTIVFAPSSDRGLMRIESSGGEPAAVTQLGTSPVESSHRYPSFLPDGRHFVYLALSESGAAGTASESELRLMLGSVDGDEPRLLLQGASNAFYAGGRLIFRHGDALQARPFDADRLRFTGEAERLAGPVHYDASYERAIFSASDDVLVFVAGNFSGETTLRVLDRDGNLLRDLLESADNANPSFSPDGKKIALAMVDGQGEFVWIYDLERGVRQRVGSGAGFEGSPVWSPDGSRVAYAHNDGSGWTTVVRRVDGDGEAEILTEVALDAEPSAWSSDGRSLVLSVNPTGASGTDLWLLEEGSEPRPLIESPFVISLPAISPDGRFLTYTSEETGRPEVYLTRFPSTRGKWLISSDGGLDSRWDASGRSIYYRTLDHAMMEIPVDFGDDETNVEFGAPRELFELFSSVDTAVRVFDVAPDGKTFVAGTISEEHLSSPITVVVNWRR